MYRQKDLDIYLKHKSDVILVWQGSDAMKLTEEWADILKTREAKHYSISHWITDSLNKHGIKSTYAPISATLGNANPIPRGNSIFFYTSHESKESSDHYGEFMIDEIRKKTGLNIIVATHDTYNKSDLYDVYKDCFINLRLTTHDGLPNCNLEMGLLGRRSIFNGMVPCSIKWTSIDSICNSIMHEYYRRGESNKDIADLTDIFVNSVNKIFL
jgi:hypothetical protein